MHLTLYIAGLTIGCPCTIADVDLLTCQWSPLHLTTLGWLWITGGCVHWRSATAVVWEDCALPLWQL